MTDKEITERGLSFSGFYNNPEYKYMYCNYQYSLMKMAGNCLNNNSEIYCVLLGSQAPPEGGNQTSSTSMLIIEGIHNTK